MYFRFLTVVLTLFLFSVYSCSESKSAEQEVKAEVECNCDSQEVSRSSKLIGGQEVSISVNGMTCTRCEEYLSGKLSELQEVTAVNKVDHKAKLVTVTVVPGTPPETIKAAIEKAGYQPSIPEHTEPSAITE